MGVKDRTGEENLNNFGSKMIITKYINNECIDVYFPEYGWECNRTYNSFKMGKITCPYEKRFFNVGYMGEGKYKTTENYKSTKYYKTWYNMLKRCYYEGSHTTNPTYDECFVEDYFLNFQNFGEWYDNNFYQIPNEKMCLDKDILVKGNKMYGRETCVFVPQIINNIFEGKMINASWDKTRNKWVVYISKYGKRKFLGRFTEYNIACEVSKKEKESYIKEVANKYKEYLPNNIYNVLLNYKVGDKNE